MAERPEDLNLPQSVISRIMKDAIPDGVSISKEARNAVSKAASVFVLYATSCANNYAMKGKRKTLNAQDVLAAMKDMEFEEFVEPLEHSLDEYRQGKKQQSELKKKQKTQEESEANTSSEMEEGKEAEEEEEEVEEVDDEEEEENEEEGEEEGEEEATEEVKEVESSASDDVQVIEDD